MEQGFMQYTTQVKASIIKLFTNKTGLNFISPFMLAKQFQAVGDKREIQS